MKLRVFLPDLERADAGTRMRWMLLDAHHGTAREGSDGATAIPRADDVEAILPAARVLFARLKLPRVGAGTLREILPYAVEDRLLADPAQIHAVAAAADARGETLVAVIDREWLAGMLQWLQRAGLRVAHAWCESALVPREAGTWHLVLGAARGMLVEEDGLTATFDRSAGADFPLALRIALDEAAARGSRPEAVHVHAEGATTLPDLARWSAEAGLAFERAAAWDEIARAERARDALDLLAEGMTAHAASRRWRIPRAAVALVVAIAALQLVLDGAQAWRLAREKAGLDARAEAIFREAFPEARTVVDPQLQMARNLAELRRSRGLAAQDDFLAQLTSAARAANGPVDAIEYANGKLVVVPRGARAPAPK